MEKTNPYKFKFHKIRNISNKRVVDINILLNEVKLEKKIEIKKNLFLISAIILGLGIFVFLLL